MKMNKKTFPSRLASLGVFGAAALAALTTSAADMVHYKSRVGSKVTITGTSTIHNWTMDSQIIGGSMDVPVGVEFDQTKAALNGATGGKIPMRVEANIPVASLKNGHWEGMDEVMQQAMHAAEHPQIVFRLSEITLKEPHAAGTPFQFDAKGDLVVNGVTNAITMPVSIESVSPVKLKVVGKKPLKMTDFKVQPPVKASVFKAGDDITIDFEWVVGRPAAAK